MIMTMTLQKTNKTPPLIDTQDAFINYYLLFSLERHTPEIFVNPLVRCAFLQGCSENSIPQCDQFAALTA